MKHAASKNALIKTRSSPAMTNKAPEKPINKKNVMMTIHNVTVASPPSSASKERSASTSDIKQTLKLSNHSRFRTRTIAPEDSILNQRRMENDEKVKKPMEPDEPVKQVEPVKEPIAFEINFEEAKKPKKVEAEEEFNYESDFESYESDFEAEVASSSASSEKLDQSADEHEEVNQEVNDFVENGKISNRIDSGSFEMNSKKSVTPSSVHYDSIDDTINSHDSGISYDEQVAMSKRVLSPKVHEFYRRGEELMKKITLDLLSFDIFEAKPIPYETFMSVYGQRNMTQVSTQCESLMTVDEVQTDPIAKAEIWTQFPSKFTKAGLEVINSKLYNEEKLGVGDGTAEVTSNPHDDPERFTQFIDAINNFAKTEITASTKSYTTASSTELQKFVESAALTIANVIDNQTKQQDMNPSRMSISRGFSQLKLHDIAILHDTIISKLYTNACINNFVVTVHKRRGSQQNFLCLWDVLNSKRPMKIFNSWSDVKCLEIHDHQRDVIAGGCNDGTICLWDVQEFLEWKDEGEVTSTVKPCEIVSLNQSSNDFALDNVVALKSLPHREHRSKSTMFSQSQASQICSLHKNGTIIIWTISRMQTESFDGRKKAELDYTHAKSRVKLIKNISIDLNAASSKAMGKENVKRKSAFEKTRYYFENDLFSDKVLRELQEIDSSRLTKAKMPADDELMRFNTFTASLNEIFVASDMNYIVAISRLNLGDKTRKIVTNDSSFISPTSVKIHPVNTNVLAIGQANGEVKFMKVYDDDVFSPSSSSKLARKSNEASGLGDILSKSCAFQNIVEKEKKLYNETQALNNLESDELKAFLINEALSEQFSEDDAMREMFKVPFDKNIFNSFEVSTGAVSLLEFSRTGEFLFVLVGRRLRIFNCWVNAEVEQQEKNNICDVKCVHGADSSEYLVRFKTFRRPERSVIIFPSLQILVTTDNEVLVNKLKR